ncbi:MAG: MFS transporter [bacterium]|nr:MFS transporter [bacterium]
MPESTDQNHALNANVWKFYLFKTIWGLGAGLAVPIFVLFFLSKDLTLARFMVLMSVLNISIFLFEVPAGIVADRFSRKWSVVLGYVFIGLSILGWLVFDSYPLLILAFTVWGLGESLMSGADSALLYDSLKAVGRENDFQKTMGNAISLMMAALVAGAAACGPIVARLGLPGPLWVGLAILSLNVLLGMFFCEPPLLREPDASDHTGLRAHLSGYTTHLKSSIHFLGNNRELIALALINIVVLRLCHLADRPFAQPYLKTFSYTPEQISYCYTFFYLITALFSKYSHRVSRILRSSERASLALIGVLGIASLILMANAPLGAIAVSSFAGIYLMRGLFTPLIDASLNRRIPSDKRASLLSIAKMGNNFLGIFLGPLFGYLADIRSLSFSLDVFQWVFGTLLAAATIWSWKALTRLAPPSN